MFQIAIIFATGFLIGAAVLACTLLPWILRWKSEHEAMGDALEATHDRMRSNEKNRAIAQKQYMAANKKLDEAQIEIERLRQEQLKAWGIPESY
jgi:hypothetical protein